MPFDRKWEQFVRELAGVNGRLFGRDLRGAHTLRRVFDLVAELEGLYELRPTLDEVEVEQWDQPWQASRCWYKARRHLSRLSGVDISELSTAMNQASATAAALKPFPAAQKKEVLKFVNPDGSIFEFVCDTPKEDNETKTDKIRRLTRAIADAASKKLQDDSEQRRQLDLL